MKYYWALVTFIVEPGLERSSKIEFEASSRKDAIKDAVRFARNRERTFEDWKFSCVKVGEFLPKPIREDGSLQKADHWNFFEWKHDWPGTLEERVEVFA